MDSIQYIPTRESLISCRKALVGKYVTIDGERHTVKGVDDEGYLLIESKDSPDKLDRINFIGGKLRRVNR